MVLSSTRPTPAETLGQQLAGLGAGAHACQIYESSEQQLDTLVQYFRAGIARGEQCLYVADAASVDALRTHGFGRDEDLARNAFVAPTARDAYLRSGHFDPDEMIQFLAERLAAAHAAGFAGLRLAGEMNWALGPDVGAERLIEYEARLNEFLPASGMRVLCQYDSRRVPASILRDVLRTHPLAILGDQIHDNLYFEPPALVLPGADVDDRRVVWMRERLVARTRREQALADLGQLALDGAHSKDFTDAVARLVAAEIGVDFVQIYDVPSAGDVLHLGMGQPLIVPDWSEETHFEPARVPPVAWTWGFSSRSCRHGSWSCARSFAQGVSRHSK